MDATSKGRNAHRRYGRGKRLVHPGVGDVRQLKRFSSNYCWKLLRLLLEVFSDQLSKGVYTELRDVFRRQNAAEYYALDAQLGLQCMAHWVDPMQGNPAVIHMLVSAMRKSDQIELAPSRERRLVCLTQVRAVDDAIPTLRSEWLTDPVYVCARRWLEQVLGPTPTNEAVSYSSRHGPGSTASIPYDHRSTYFKYVDWPYRTTPLARGQLASCITTDARWVSALEDSLRRRFEVPMWSILDRTAFSEVTIDGGHPYNVVTTVPKDGRKDRPIAKEQTGNIYLQLGVGAILRQRLRCFGIDLDRQAMVNRRIALESSRTKEYFTIDLSNASDTVGYDLVKALLPPDWFRLLDSLRSPWGVLPSGEAFLYRKFSSMGNGFTFELESLLFLAICKGIQRVYGDRRDKFFTFGDDIIGPDYLYTHCCAYLRYSGFQVNSEKSFSGKARVRESCGVDALDGSDIRPVFIKGTPKSVMDGIGTRNRIRAWCYRQLGDYPAKLDGFLIGDTFYDMPPVGPDSDVEFNGWLQDGPRAAGTHYASLVGTVRQLPAREWLLRRLMHSLRSCSGEGGNFLVTDEAKRVKLVDRVVFEPFSWLSDY